jgi:outer membrane protein assembly factor BamA
MQQLFKYITIFFLLLEVSMAYSQDVVVKTAFLHKMVTIRNIMINGNTKTQDHIILREIPVTIANEYTMPFILESMVVGKQNLMNTSLFVDATVDFTHWFNDSLDLNINVKERWYWFPLPFFNPIDRNWNVWMHDHQMKLERVNYGLKVMGMNVSGKNDKVNLFLINGYAQQIAFNYSNPFAGKNLNHGYSIDFSYSKNREINYNTQNNKQIFFRNDNAFMRSRFLVGVGYSYRKASIARHTVRLNYVEESITDSVRKLNPNFFNQGKSKEVFPELTYRYQYFNVDYIPYPRKGLKWELNFLKRGITSSMNLWQLQANVYKYINVYPGFFYTLQLQGSLKLPFKQPYYNQILLGYGDNYLRGMEYFVLDGVAGGIIKNTLNKHLFDFKLRTGLHSSTYSVIPFRFYLKAYTDIGYSFNQNNFKSNSLANKFLYSGGLGLDIVSIYDVVIRLEYSINQVQQKGFFVHANE